jgi:hypothetical protein
MALYLLQRPQTFGATIIDGRTAAIVEADSEAAAIRVATAQDAGDSPWSGATATEITAGVAADYAGFTYNVKVSGDPLVAGSADIIDVTYTGVAADTVDDIGDGLAALLVAAGLTATYTGATNTLEVAAAGDAIGDHTLVVEARLPNADSPLSDLVGAITDQGLEGDALSVVLEDETAIPAILAQL